MADVSVEARERMKTEYIREDRTVEGWYIETHYTPCKGIADANGYLRVLVDEEGYDTETRILHETLNGIGWVKSAALSANNQERAEAVPIAYLKAQTSSLEWNGYAVCDPRDPNAIPVVAATPHPPTAEPVDPAYPFYELKFIMRVLSHKGGAPKQDWDTAYGMAREIFSRWHKDRQSTAEGQPKQGRAADGVVSDEQLMRVIVNACDSLHITRVHELGGKTRTIMEDAGLLEIARAVLAIQPPSASPVAVPDMPDLQWLHLPEIFAKFIDYAKDPTDANAQRIITAASERIATSKATS